MKYIEIGNKKIGPGYPTFIIAEACDNHMGSVDSAIEMARQAKLSGADCIKFQHHIPEEEMLPNTPMSDNFDEPLFDFLKKYSLSIDQHRRIKEFCSDIGIIYLCTPFSWAAAKELNSLDVHAYKVGSGEMTDIPTLVRIASFNKPMIISTGMSTFEEIKRTYDSLSSRKVPLALLNCVSEYPPVYEDLNLGVITKMKEFYPEAIIGHSDHTPDLYTSFAAVTLGANIVEKHVILDKNISGPDQSVSIDFNDLSELVDGIRKVEVSLGSNKGVHSKEEQIRTWAFRSIVSTIDIKDGDIINESMIWSKRPGTGIPAYLMDEIIGKKAIKNIPKNSLLSWDALED